ncbi:hypothetical protein [Pseudomonas atacamensis]|uniref:Sel1 domain protein repeat-containing protein n=1 Tax=Pseudomonas iranensis TaxID=2745503 RepID=A0AAU7F1I8_9PSED
MKPSLPQISPSQFHPFTIDATIDNRLKLPDGMRSGEVSANPLELDVYCQSSFGKSWSTIKNDARRELAKRMVGSTARLSAFKELLRHGQPAATLADAYSEFIESLRELHSDGSLNALIIIGEIEFSIGCYFHSRDPQSLRIEALRGAIDLGSVAALSMLGDHFLVQGRIDEAITAYHEGSGKECYVCLYQLGRFTEQGAGAITISEKAAFDLYRQASNYNYPPAAVAMVNLWLRSSESLPLPGNPISIVKDALDRGCEGAAMVLAELYQCTDGEVDTPVDVVSLYRCAALAGDVAAQLRLANLLAGNELSKISIQQDTKEAIAWYRRILESNDIHEEIEGQIRVELAQLLMWQEKYAEAAYHFSLTVEYYPEALNMKSACELKVEAEVELSMR